ncbi:type II toxin-antitoxin system VapC family toxin [Nocardioides nitrophenolicus]|uniref:type II toxin-antitoxin system VapC family toxin n=1 Tax=Nocardioides nitrophenolicus TaxID=60489 RepID=UPI00195DD111|nr:type II toxin-antitoxin system VapC family toxin [Nocardioides nitrophenolicus]MBM7517403.1 PIN domain nuclease of toxin-antitoxin system [Nocardioides nitrophenolicus]
MNLLLDTHVLLWLAADDSRLTAVTRELLAGASQRHVSAASAYEIALKTRLGRLPGGTAVLDGWGRLMRNLQASELPLSVAHMARAGSMDWHHLDPFDRMLVAQAQLEGLTLVTDDGTIRDFHDVRTRWA